MDERPGDPVSGRYCPGPVVVVPYSKAPELALWGSDYEGNGRAYRKPGAATGSDVPSVTSVLKYYAKNLDGWRTREVAKWCIEHWAELGGDPDKVLNYAISAPERTRDTRAWVGSGLHAYVQAEDEGTWDYPELDSEQLEMVAQWDKFNQAVDRTAIHSELTVWNDTYGYAGTLDGIWIITDPLTGESWVWLVDLKTSRNTWDDHWMQLAALLNGERAFVKVSADTEGAIKDVRQKTGGKVTTYWQEIEMPKVDKVGILHLRADKVELLEAEDIDIRFEQFLGYLTQHKLEVKLNERRKTNGH